VFVFLWAAAKDLWYSKWRIALAWDVPTEKVFKDNKPHDCSFFAAPLGEKYCHYQVEFSTLRWATSTTGNPIASLDEGKTWDIFTPDAGVSVPKMSTIQQVYVFWKKVEE